MWLYVVGHRHHQAVDAGDAVQLVKVPGEHAVDPHLGGYAPLAVSKGALVAEVGVDKPGAVRFPQAVAVGVRALAAVDILPVVPVGHQAVLCQAQRGGGAGHNQRQQDAQRPSALVCQVFRSIHSQGNTS